METATVILSGARTTARWRRAHIVVGQPASLRAWSRDLVGTIQPVVELTVAGIPAWWHDPAGALAGALDAGLQVDMATFGVMSARLVIEDHAETLLSILDSGSSLQVETAGAAAGTASPAVEPEPEPAPEPEPEPEPEETPEPEPEPEAPAEEEPAPAPKTRTRAKSASKAAPRSRRKASPPAE